MRELLIILITLTISAVQANASFTLSIQFKPEVCADKTKQPTETAYWQPCFVQAAKVVQQMNVLFTDQLIHGPLKSNPDATQVEGFLGDINTPANEAGVVTATFENYHSLKIPYLPPYYLDADGKTQLPLPFLIYLGNTDEQKEVGKDKEGNPIYETIQAGKLL